MKLRLLLALTPAALAVACSEITLETGFDEVPVVDLRVEPAAVDVAVGDAVSVRAVGTLEDGTVRTVSASWEVGDGSVARVDAGSEAVLVQGVAEGATTVTARVRGGQQASASVTVGPPEAAFRVVPSRTNLPVGGRLSFTALLPGPGGFEVPADARWSVSDAAVATIDDATGALIGVSEGAVEVTATREDGTRTATVVVGAGMRAATPTLLHREARVAGLAFTTEGDLLASVANAGGEGFLVLLSREGELLRRIGSTPVGRLHSIPGTGAFILLEREGGVHVVEADDFRVRNLFEIRRAGVATGTIHDARTASTNSFGGRINTATASFGDFGVVLRPDTLEVFAAGTTEDGYGFVLRFRRANSFTASRVMLSSSATDGAGPGVRSPVGLAMDREARMLTAVPAEADDTEAGWTLSPVRFRRTFEPAVGERPIFAVGKGTALHPTGGASDGLGNLWLSGGGETPLSTDLGVTNGLAVFAAEDGLVAVVETPWPVPEVVVEPTTERAFGIVRLPEGDMAVADLAFSLSDGGG